MCHSVSESVKSKVYLLYRISLGNARPHAQARAGGGGGAGGTAASGFKQATEHPVPDV